VSSAAAGSPVNVCNVFVKSADGEYVSRFMRPLLSRKAAWAPIWAIAGSIKANQEESASFIHGKSRINPLTARVKRIMHHRFRI
jgi:hypothetical protein